jgi:hypothetical protein
MMDNYEYRGTPKGSITPVFKLACRLRFKQPNADEIIGKTKRMLDREIVSSLLEAFLENFTKLDC